MGRGRAPSQAHRLSLAFQLLLLDQASPPLPLAPLLHGPDLVPFQRTLSVPAAACEPGAALRPQQVRVPGGPPPFVRPSGLARGVSYLSWCHAHPLEELGRGHRQRACRSQPHPAAVTELCCPPAPVGTERKREHPSHGTPLPKASLALSPLHLETRLTQGKQELLLPLDRWEN